MVIYVNMGEKVVSKGTDSAHENREVFYASGVDRLARFVDKHPTEIRVGLCGVAVLGVVIIGRSVRIFTTFCHIDAIPSRFIEQHVRLRGNVKRVGQDATLYVEHIPIIRLPHRGISDKEHLLPVSLAGGINILETGHTWLEKHVVGHNVWFKPLRVTGGNKLECIVLTRAKWSLPYSVNKELVTRGFAMIATDRMLRGSRSGDAVISRLEMSLIQAEWLAQREGRGVWVKPSSTFTDLFRLPVSLVNRVRLKLTTLFKR